MESGKIYAAGRNVSELFEELMWNLRDPIDLLISLNFVGKTGTVSTVIEIEA